MIQRLAIVAAALRWDTVDIDERGEGIVDRQRLYQLVREPGQIRERTAEIAFLARGVEAYVFTFG